jgi:ABC-type Fe3+-siderophore transport system permease subunit
VAPVEIPVGIITALIGGPFFLAMLVQGQARQRLRV